MIKKIITGLFCCTLFLTCSSVEWLCKDGTGSRIVKDSSADKLHLMIRTPDKVDWAREDDRGFFLVYDGGVVARLVNEKFQYPDGISIRIRFAANLKKAPRQWLPLITNYSYDKGVSIWVNKNGNLLVTFPGTTNWYKMIPSVIRDQQDHDLRVTRAAEKVQVILNNKVIANYPSKGKVKVPPKNTLFYLGSTYSWPFHGNIYSCSITPFKAASFVKGKTAAPKKLAYPGDEIKPMPHIKDPAGTIVIKDFDKFTPKPGNHVTASAYGWTFRRCSFFPKCPGALFAPWDPDDEDIITYKPGVKGSYDVYLGLRITGADTDLVMAVPDQKNRYRVRIGRAGYKFHPNTEVLVARNVRMDKGAVMFFPGSHMFLGYIKLIPSKNPRKVDFPKWKCVSVERINGDYSLINAEKIRRKIRSKYLIERTFTGPKSVASVTAESRKRGYVLFPQDWMDLCFEHIAPAADPGRFTLQLKAAKGEFEPVSFGVHGLKDCGKITLTGGDALKKKGMKVDITTILSIAKRTTNYTNSSEFIVAPQCLERTNTAVLKKGRTKQFWITVKVPENIKAGIYRDHFVLHSSKGKQKIPVKLEVYPFKLGEVRHNLTGLFGSSYIFSGKFSKENVIREMAEHGLNSLFFIRIQDLISWHRDAKGNLICSSDDPKIEKLMRVVKENRIKTILLHANDLTYMMYGKKNGAEDFCKIVKSLSATAKARNWPELYFYGSDEVLSMPHKLKMTIWEAEQLKKCNVKIFHTHIWFKTTRPYQKEVDILSKNIDIFCNRFNNRNLWYKDSWSVMQDESVKRNRELWSYNADNAILFTQTAMKRFSHGWFFRSLGDKTRGQATWAYHHFSGSPYNDLDYNGTDWCYVYPANRRYKGGFAIDYEAIREGVDDLRYIQKLEDCILRAKKRKLNTAGAETVLSDLKKSFDFGENFRKKSIYLTSSFEKVWEKNGKRYCSGTYNLPNGWSFADYHKAREKVAAEIIKLERKLK